MIIAVVIAVKAEVLGFCRPSQRKGLEGLEGVCCQKSQKVLRKRSVFFN